MVMKRATGDARPFGQRVEGDGGEALFGKGATGGGDEPGRRLFGSLGAGRGAGG